LQKLGGVPQQIAGGDIYPALEKGTLDACEWVGPYDDEKLGFYKIAPHYYYPGWWEGGSMIFAFINIDKWNSLPKNYQAILEQAGAYANTWMVAQYDQLNPASLRKLLAGGTKCMRLRPDHGSKLQHRYGIAWQIAKENASFKKVNDSMMEFTRNGYQWFQVAELSYDTFMIRKSRG
jgi:TRAP-type mannitol/chloroaromatic compound transport system substrate-binding protein